MRLFVSVIATAIFFSASLASAAVTWTLNSAVASGGDIDAMLPGDTLTLTITLRSDGADELVGLGGSVYGFTLGEEANLVGGQVADHALASVCGIPGLGCVGGFANVALAASGPQPDVTGGTSGVDFLSGISFPVGTSNTGEADVGFDGVAGSPQFQVVLSVLRSATLNIGAGDPTDGALTVDGVAVTNDTSVSYTVVPEPGTALLMGLGLAGLAAAGRRE